MLLELIIAMLPGLLLVLAAMFAGPGVAIVLLLLHQRRRRAQRRAAFDKQMLRAPGHSLREQIEEHRSEVVWGVLQLAVMPLFILAVFLVQTRVSPSTERLWPVYALLAAALVIYESHQIASRSKKLDALRAGYDAELAAGQELDRLMLSGAHVFHDVPADGFNVDHVVIGAAGLFAIETKGFSKPAHILGKPGSTVKFNGSCLRFPTWSTSAPLEQAERQAQWLAKWCSAAIGEAVTASPVLALPGWYVERVGKGPVRVLSGGELRHLMSVASNAISPQVIRQLAHQVDHRCRDVATTASKAEKA